MSYAHRNGDTRACGATTTVIGQNFVIVAGQLWAVEGDTETHGDGQLINSQSFVRINGIPVILQNDTANPDDLCPPDGGAHCTPYAVGYSSLINVT
jgi:uncharacterized Zn-binding protein involved in type VI secretion